MKTFDPMLESGITQFVVRDVVKVDNTASVDVALEKFKATPYGAVLVTDSATQALSGIITGTDLTKLRQSTSPQTAGDLASTEVVAIRQDAQMWQLLKIMNGENALRRQLDSLPVVDNEGKPVGIIKRERLLGRLTDLENA